MRPQNTAALILLNLRGSPPHWVACPLHLHPSSYTVGLIWMQHWREHGDEIQARTIVVPQLDG